MSLIDCRHDGRRIVIPVQILAASPATDLHGFSAQALIDTGATTSGIAPHVVSALQLLSKGKRPLGSANGEWQAERYLFRIGLYSTDGTDSNPRFPFIFDDILGFGLTGFALDALIGMDILAQCDFTMRKPGECRLIFG